MNFGSLNPRWTPACGRRASTTHSPEPCVRQWAATGSVIHPPFPQLNKNLSLNFKTPSPERRRIRAVGREYPVIQPPTRVYPLRTYTKAQQIVEEAAATKAVAEIPVRNTEFTLCVS